MRRFRENQKTLQCNADVTECNADVTECNADVTEQSYTSVTSETDVKQGVTKCNIELEKELEKEKDKEKELEKEKDNITLSNNNNTTAYGVHKNVFLSDQEYKELVRNYSKRFTDETIDRMSEYIKYKRGGGYGNKTFSMICTWINQDYAENDISQARKESIKGV